MPIPLSLYIHIPWCEKKCPYCDFNSHQTRNNVNEHEYIQNLLFDLSTDLKHYKQHINHRPVTSIFIGGGTPSLFSPESIRTLLVGVRQQLDLSPNLEITMEANPGSSEATRFEGYREAGVNRLSIGVQSFDPVQLKHLGRIHSEDDAISAVKIAKQTGFENFNIDLMFGLPEQQTTAAVKDLEQALALNPSHISCYQLTIEPNTLFFHQPPITPNDEELWKMQNALQGQLAQAGFYQYEVSAYALTDKQCVHNLNYWQFGDYLGIGAGAHSKLTLISSHSISPSETSLNRAWKIKHPTTYQQYCKNGQAPIGERTIVARSDHAFEFMLNALRLSDGFDLNQFSQRTAHSLKEISEQLNNHRELDLITIKNNWLTPTLRGRSMIDTMLQDYLA